MSKQSGDGGLLRGKGDIDLAALNQIHIGAALDQHHGFLCAHALSQHGRHNIRFIVVGDGNKRIHLFYAFFTQQCRVRGIAAEHNGFIQMGRQILRSFRAVLDELNVVIVLQALSQTGTN